MTRFFHRLICDDRGNTFILVAFGMMALVGAMGAAVDIGRGELARMKLQTSIDAAGLAAGGSINSTDVNDEVRKYVELNFSRGTLDAVITDVRTQVSDDTLLLTIDADATMPTTLMRVFGIDTITLHAHSEITRTNKGMELVMVLDTTGSMAGTKLTSLQTASNDLIDILFGDKKTGENLWIGVVPFSQAVNVGNAHTDWVEPSYTTWDWGTTSWAGCVEARYTGRDITDAPPFGDPGTPPDQELFRAYYWADHDSYNNWIRTSSDTSTRRVCRNSNNCTCSNYSCGCTTNGNSQVCISCSGSGSGRDCDEDTTTTTTSYSINSSRGPNAYCPSEVTRMTSSKAGAKAGIAALVAQGNTHVSEGAAWGWRMLSPRWRGLWGGTMATDSLPLDYDTDLMIKAAVIMTDGENTITNSVDGAYDYLSDGRLGTTNSGAAVTQLNNRLRDTCAAMKAKGIIVYTVVFNLSSPTVDTLLRNCASQPDYYFNSPDAAALRQAFRTIGDSLANLRISK